MQYMGLCVFSLPIFFTMIVKIRVLYYQHQLCRMTHLPLFRAMSWASAIRCTYFYIVFFSPVLSNYKRTLMLKARAVLHVFPIFRSSDASYVGWSGVGVAGGGGVGGRWGGGNNLLKTPVVRGRCAREAPHHTFDIGVFTCSKTSLRQTKTYLQRICNIDWQL